jgi:hypothetical protein
MVVVSLGSEHYQQVTPNQYLPGRVDYKYYAVYCRYAMVQLQSTFHQTRDV